MRDVGPDEAYALAIELDSIEGYAEFLDAYPRHPYGRRLFQLIRSRRESMAWLRANQINTPPAYWTYLRRYAHGLYGFDATRKLRALGLTSTPPADFKPVEFDDVPPPLPGEPEDYIGGYDDAPAPPGPAPEQSAAAPPDTPPANPPPPSAAPPSTTPPKNDRRTTQKPEPRQPPRTPPQTSGSRPAPSAPAQRQPGGPQSCEIIDGMKYCRW